MTTILTRSFTFLYYFYAILFGLWSIPAVYFLKIFSQHSFNLALAITYAVLLLLLQNIPTHKKIYRTFTLLLFAVVFLRWNQMTPAQDKNWADAVSRLPRATIEHNKIHIHDIRDFIYQSETDYKIQYIDKTYDLTQLNQLDYVLAYWDGNKEIAHSIFSFGFENGDRLAISTEVRNQKGEEYGGFTGLYNQFELIYVLATERDALQLRTNFRGEDVYSYPTNASKQEIRYLFNVVIDRVNTLYNTPKFYNTVTQNCFTSLMTDFRKAGGKHHPFDYRLYANGFSDEMFYQNGVIKSALPFLETKQRFNINQYIQPDIYNANYSQQIRPYKN